MSPISALNGERKSQGSCLNRTILLTLGWKLGGKTYRELILSHAPEERFTRNCDKVACSLCLQHRGFPSHRAPFVLGHSPASEVLLHDNARTNQKFQPSLSKNRKKIFWLLPGISHKTQDQRIHRELHTAVLGCQSGVSGARSATQT